MQEHQVNRRTAVFRRMLSSSRIDIREKLCDPDQAYQSLNDFLHSKSQVAGQGLPYRHSRLACHNLRSRTGADAVRLTAELLVDVTRSAKPDYELAGLVATACFEFALTTPSLVTSSLRTSLGSEADLMAFLAALIAAPPLGVSITTAIAFTCLLGPLDCTCVKSLITHTQRPDFGDWVLIEQTLLGVGRVEAEALPLILDALKSSRPRTALLAIRLLGVMARDATINIDIRRDARLALESFGSGSNGMLEIHIFTPSTVTNQEGCILACGTLASIAATELFSRNVETHVL